MPQRRFRQQERDMVLSAKVVQQHGLEFIERNNMKSLFNVGTGGGGKRPPPNQPGDKKMPKPMKKKK